MKIALVLIFSFFTHFAVAQEVEHNNCSSSLLNISDWSKLSEATTACLKVSVDFNSGVASLCDSDMSEISPAFNQYLYYQAKYQDALAELQAVSIPTAVARNKVAQAKMDWDTMGSRSSISIVINKVKNSLAICDGN